MAQFTLNKFQTGGHMPNQVFRRRRSFLDYYRRIFSAYLGRAQSQLTFWHEVPEVNPRFTPNSLGEYYMTFSSKADYPGPFDAAGIPMLNYRGRIGKQYNPIAIAQYGLGNYNIYTHTGDPSRRKKFLLAADWLLSMLTPNSSGLAVWMHNFDWEYRDLLCAPWYSGLAQGQGISVLVRAHQFTGNPTYLNAARKAFECFTTETTQGGVISHDKRGNIWFEEYIVFPPTHILNGFIWALWGVYDYFLVTRSNEAEKIFNAAVRTLSNSLGDYDVGFWSLYEQPGTKLSMVASPFYHSLHIVQLRITERLTGERTFGMFADRWQSYEQNRVKRMRALIHKAVFKLLYY
ncbi:MAG: hypothetical protein DMG65_22895 [Candidatus Angelobacter sp. Gp1-AA117]|nr:MAG: hypothetical protein DMG65_22895 [Candidatus Angelobacter sp. Gp1-AA117]